jgi:hypothetical protein
VSEIDDTTIDGLERLFGQARSARWRFEPDWYLNLAFFQNLQWLGWNGTYLFRPQLPSNRVLLVDNRIMPIIEKEVARLTKQKPTYVATPATPSDDDISAAELAEQVLEFLWKDLGVQAHFYEALKWSRICGAGFLKTVWDKTLGDSTDILVGPDDQPLLGADQRPLKADAGISPEQLSAQLGVPVRSMRIGRGNIRVSVCSPFQIYVDPNASKLDDAEFLFEESILSEDQVEERYRRRLRADVDANPGLVESRMGTSQNSGGYKGVRVVEYWRQPCKRHPNGLRVVWGGREILERDDKPFDTRPYVMLRGIDVPGRFWPMGIAEALRPLQAELNKVKSQLAENRNRIGNPSLLAARSAAMDPDEFEAQVSQPGGIVYYDDPSSIPTYLEAPQMPQYISQEIERIEAAIQEVAGQHEISNAQVPAGVTAASAINLLLEADDTRLGPAATDLARQLATFGQKQLRLADRFYDDERKISLVGEDNAWQIIGFRGQMLRGHDNVDVQDASLIPQSKAARHAAMQNMLNTFIQNGIPLSPRQMARFVRDFQVGGLEHLIADYSPDEQQINREHRKMQQGVEVQVNRFDNDEAHVEGHDAWFKTSAFDRLPDPVKLLALAHRDEHARRLAEAEAAAAQAENAPQQAQSEQQMATQTAQAEQQMAQQAERHQQQVVQSDELHAQRLRQAQQQPTRQ